MIREASETAKYRALLVGLIMLGAGLINPTKAVLPLVFGIVIILIATYERYMQVLRRTFND